MPMTSTLASALFASTLLFLSAAGTAHEIEAPADATTTTRTPTHGLFASWFAPKRSDGTAVVDESDEADEDLPAPVATLGAPRAGELISGALGLIGISYRMGGDTPATGFDCSGLVRYVFRSALGLDLPRRAEEISRTGRRVERDELRPGDLVFYKTLRKTFSHVGIYLGQNRFIHSPSAGGSVRVDDMTQGYWTKRFNGARRVGP